jgi:F0F1-type ATP synthase membrane subunit b/b'
MLKQKLTEVRYCKADLQKQCVDYQQQQSELEARAGAAYERLEAARRDARDAVDARLEEEETEDAEAVLRAVREVEEEECGSA